MNNNQYTGWQNGSEAEIEHLERQRDVAAREGEKFTEEPEAQKLDNQAWAKSKNSQMAKVLEMLEKKGVERQSFGVAPLEFY